MKKPFVFIRWGFPALFVGALFLVVGYSSVAQDTPVKSTGKIATSPSSKKLQKVPAVSLFTLTEQTFSQYLALTGSV
ncbi:MAG: efflux RND transporter periplasmic adaptor subunit, partial [Shewanella sp.]